MSKVYRLFAISIESSEHFSNEHQIKKVESYPKI